MEGLRCPEASRRPPSRLGFTKLVKSEHDVVAKHTRPVTNILPRIPVLARNPDLAAPGIRSLDNFIGVNNPLSVLCAAPM